MMPGKDQWKLSRIELVNWGTFDGYHIMNIDPKGLLITGESGSGKSTILDAVATVLTPPRKRHFNAAARSDDSKGEDRTLASYIRGAWKHEADDAGDVTNAYLRKGGAVWSGILLRYENESLHGNRNTLFEDYPNVEAANLIALFNIKAGSNTNDGVSQLFILIDGDYTLKDFEPYAINGIDSRKLKSDFGTNVAYFREHGPFALAFCRKLGIESPKTLELLHKTQAAKNFGSLNELFRNFMLDVPKTFEQKDEAVAQFSALSQAHAGVVDQRRQMEYLEPLVKLIEQHEKAQKNLEMSIAEENTLTGYTAQLAVSLLESQKQDAERRRDEAQDKYRQAQSNRMAAQQNVSQAQKMLEDAGGSALNEAHLHMLEYQKQLNSVKGNRESLKNDLASAYIENVPDTYSEWQDMGREIANITGKAKAAPMQNREANFESFGRVPDLKKQISQIESELRHLRSRPTNIPQNLDDV
ncbi:MAG: ATP-binding protein, partial [Eggerthellaceae bacterium]|nr:ATP-binding protein [Eggerthellaceae bacterium]